MEPSLATTTNRRTSHRVLAACGVSAGALLCAAALAPTAHASSGGNPNSGDVWVQDSTSYPGHQNDPHLSCGTIYLEGSGLADSGGVFSIDSWPPSGSQQPVNGFTNLGWSYNTATGGTQTIATFSGQALVSAAAAQGATGGNPNGYHFKLDFSQDPQKHKTFWVNCSTGSPSPTPAPTPAPGPGGGGEGGPGGPGGGGGGGTPSPTPAPTAAPTPAPTSTAAPTATAAPAPSPTAGGGTGGISTTPAPSGGVLGITTTPSPAPGTPVTGSAGTTSGIPAPGSGVAGSDVSTPLTGAAVPGGIAAALLLTGTTTLALRRRLRHQP